ncbi:hypothetical protein PG994_000925 [Apiospora phragmitis]|uniref:Uncharacterized protein n=1 Tax=Apiospora phragmitis TaxID=2905665 RepID=A0ABR1WR10_9PEZI
MFSQATQGHAVFTRLRGNAAFYIYLAKEMNPLAPPLGRRRRADLQKSELVIALEMIIKLHEDANALDRIDHIKTLKPPKPLSRPFLLKGAKNNSGIVVSANTLWPPAHFSALDIAHLCQHDVHTTLFGITPENPGSLPTYPTDQDNPIACALVAFLDDDARETWYTLTGHKSRFYSTLPEFIDDAKQALRNNSTERVICLLTPWFYDADEVMTLSGGHVALPIAWQNQCYRSGMTLIVDRDGKTENNRVW